LRQVDTFLQRLLLLTHITGGQPARGTELLSIQYCNTVHGLLRNIFIENGLVSFVTCYHKGYIHSEKEKEKEKGEQSLWPSHWLAKVISREFKNELGTEANI
jgi:hypothetical protein